MTCEYLYGSGVDVPKVPKDIVDARITLLEENLGRLLAISYEFRDTKRIKKVADAIVFWEHINK